jgi:hypothetical protein
MSRQHTPGPWAVGHRKGQPAIRGAATECVAVIPSPTAEGYGVTSDAERLANASLMAAAPDLLFVVEKILESGVSIGGHHRALAIAAASKAKAALAVAE